jgi:hypothetical protein
LKTWDINDKEIDPVFEAVKIGLEDASNKARETARDAFGYLYHYHQKKAEKLKNDLPKATQAKLVISLDGLNNNNNFSSENAESAFTGTGGSGGGSGKMSGNNSPSKTTTSGHSNSNSFSSSSGTMNAHKSMGILKTPSSSTSNTAAAAAAPTSVSFATQQHVRSQSGNITFNNPSSSTPSHPLVPHVNSNNSMNNTSNNSINTINTMNSNTNNNNNNNSNNSMNSNPSITGMLPPHPLVSGSASKSGSFTMSNNNNSNNNNNLSTGNNPATGGGTPNPLLMNKVPANADAYTSGTKIATMSSVDHNSLALQAGVRNALSRRRSVVKNPFAELSDSMKAASSDSGTIHSTGHHSHHSHHHSMDLKAAQHDFIQSNSQPKSIRGGGSGGGGKKDSEHNRTYSMDDTTVISALTSHTTQYQQQPLPQTPIQQPAVSLLSLPKNPAQTTTNSNSNNSTTNSTNSIMGAPPFQSNDFTPTRQEKKLPQQLLSSDNSLSSDK